MDKPEIAVGDKVEVSIIENGYWKGTATGRVLKITAASYIVESSARQFWNSEKAEFVPRAFRKNGPAGVRLLAKKGAN